MFFSSQQSVGLDIVLFSGDFLFVTCHYWGSMYVDTSVPDTASIGEPCRLILQCQIVSHMALLPTPWVTDSVC